MAGPAEETFAPGTGRITGVLGLVVVLVLVATDVLQPGSIPLAVVAGALVLGVLMWTTMLRPRVSVRIEPGAGGVLVMRNALSTVRVPLAAVEDLSVGQVLAVRTARRRYVASGVGRTIRQAVRSGPPGARPTSRPTYGSAFGMQTPSEIEPGMIYADFVELRLRDLAQEDRERRGVRAYSDGAEALADQVVREHAVPELLALAATVAFFVVALMVALT